MQSVHRTPRHSARCFLFPVILALLLHHTALSQRLPGTIVQGGAAGAHYFVAETHTDSTTFTDIGAGLSGSWAGDGTWFDYDNDGDLDVLLAGWDDTSYFTKIYSNDDGVFTDIHAPLYGLGAESGIAVGDYDGDGDLDFAIAGRADTLDVHHASIIYRNDGGTFTDIHAPLLPMVASVTWVDFDNDGDLDLFLCGSPDGGVSFASRLYRNDHGAFVEHATTIPGSWGSAVAWGDYDGDGDADLFISGWDGASTARLFRNDHGSLTHIANFFQPITSGSAAWVDFDGDGDLDLSWNGFSFGTPQTRLFRNDSSTSSALRLMYVPMPIASLGSSALAWGDYDNDGDLDFAESGSEQASGAGPTTKIYRNDESTFVDIHASIPGVWHGALAWGDYDKNGYLDLLVTGGTNDAPASKLSGPYMPISRIYRNTLSSPSVVGAAEELPLYPELFQNYPNPFNPTTSIAYRVAALGRVTITVCDILGRESARLLDEVKEPGSYSVTWNAGNAPSGVYLYRIASGAFTETRKMLLLH